MSTSHATATETRVNLVMVSANRKLGPIPASYVSDDTCPPGCPFIDGGCYGKGGPARLVWNRVNTGRRGVTWEEYTSRVSNLRRGTFWRHGVLGDAPGKGSVVDAAKLAELVKANRGKQGFSFSHKPVLGTSPTAVANRHLFQLANRGGFTINVSTETPEAVDEAMDHGLPAVMVMPEKSGARHRIVTPKGRIVEACPATYRKRDDGKLVTCDDCRLCAKPNRKVAVGFPAHGYAENRVRRIVTALRTGDNKPVTAPK